MSKRMRAALSLALGMALILLAAALPGRAQSAPVPSLHEASAASGLSGELHRPGLHA